MDIGPTKKINSHRDDLFLRCLWVKLDDRESEYRFNMSQRLVVPDQFNQILKHVNTISQVTVMVISTTFASNKIQVF